MTQMQARPPVVRVLSVLLVLEAAVFACLGVLAAITAVVLALTPATGGDFRDLAAVVVGVLAVLSLIGAAAGLLGWLGLRTRRTPVYLVGCLLHLLPLIGLLLLGVGRSSALMLVGVWFLLVGVLALLSEPRAWVAGGTSPRAGSSGHSSGVSASGTTDE